MNHRSIYLIGFVGGVVLFVRVLLGRRRASLLTKPSQET